MAQVMFWHRTQEKLGGRVFLVPGDNVIINKPVSEYFGRRTLEMIVRQPIELTGAASRFDIRAKVLGGGISGQAGAIKMGIARALIQADPNLRPLLKKAGFLTRDPRMKERKKYGLRKARRAPQFSKR